jgi:hypothetical protein
VTAVISHNLEIALEVVQSGGGVSPLLFWSPGVRTRKSQTLFQEREFLPYRNSAVSIVTSLGAGRKESPGSIAGKVNV